MKSDTRGLKIAALILAGLALVAAALFLLNKPYPVIGQTLYGWYAIVSGPVRDRISPTYNTIKTPWLKQEARILYPSQARLRRFEGSAIVTMTIQADGAISAAAIEQSAGHATLDRAALAAARKFQIDPGRLGAEEFPYEKKLRVTFRLEG